LADLWGGRVVRAVIADLRHEPREGPRSPSAGLANDLGEQSAVLLTRDLMSGVLVCVGLSLMPEQCTKSVRPQLPDAHHHPVEQGAIAFPRARLDFPDEPRQGWRGRKARSLRQPLPDAGRAMPDGGDADRHVIFLVERITKRRNEASTTAGVLHPLLRVIRNPP